MGKQSGSLKHGLYGAYLSDDEAAAWNDIPLGDVDHEIRMCKVWIARAMALEAAINQPVNVDGTELAEVRQSSSSEDGMTRVDVVNKRPDVAARIDRLLGRLAQLEKVRAELLAAAAERGDGVDDKARDLIETIRAIEQVEQVDETDRDD